MPSCASMESRKRYARNACSFWTCRHVFAKEGLRARSTWGAAPLAAAWVLLACSSLKSCPAHRMVHVCGCSAAQVKDISAGKRGASPPASTCADMGAADQSAGVCSARQPSCATQVSRFHPGPSRLTVPQQAASGQHPPCKHAANHGIPAVSLQAGRRGVGVRRDLNRYGQRLEAGWAHQQWQSVFVPSLVHAYTTE